MRVLDANEIFWMTFYTYDKIMETWGKRWPDAVALYVKLLKQARMQETNQTWSLNSFLEKSLWWGRERVQKAKKVLNTLWLIEYIQQKNDNWTMKTQFIKVNFIVNDWDLTIWRENRLTASPADGETTTNAYIHNINAWRNTIENTCQETGETVTRSKTRTRENKERFETFRKLYPHYESRSRKKDSKTHFLERDYDEMMFSAKMLKRKIIMHPDKAEFVPWCHKRVNNFTPMSDYQKKQAIRELYMRHRAAWWDMKTRMEDIVKDFPDIDFSEFREELSKKKTEYALWDLIPKK